MDTADALPPWREALDTPWKVRNEARRILTLPFIRLMFLMHGIRWGRNWKVYGAPIIQKHRRSTIEIGSGLNLRSGKKTNPLSPFHPVVLSTRAANSRIKIGQQFAMSGGTICASESIVIGDRVAVGANSIIVDTDFHPLDAARREGHPNEGKTVAVTIEDDVFIGANSIILKGVHLGAGCVIGAGSVVAQAVPAGAIAAGNPAKVVKIIGYGRPEGGSSEPTAQ